jgi:hypothetical protein
MSPAVYSIMSPAGPALLKWIAMRVVVATALVMSACVRDRPAPHSSDAATAKSTLIPPTSTPEPPATVPARTAPRSTEFVTGRRRGTTVVSTPDGDSIRVSWQGTCLARIEESLPGSGGAPPPECLQNAEVSEQLLPPDLSDLRAEHLFDDPAALRQWRFCLKQTPAETCLDRLLPLTGGASRGDRGGARWTKARDHARRRVGIVRRARCRLALVDRDDGTVTFRCRGTLIDAACSGDGSVTFNGGSDGCADGQMAVVGHVDDAPSDACLQSARTALRVPLDSFAAARAAALAACAPPGPLDDQELDPAPRALVHRVLARQEALLGAVALPPRCPAQDGACVAVGAPYLARVVARGCGNQVWALQMMGNVGTIGNGHWGGYLDDRQLVRLPSAAKPREPEGSPVYIEDSLSWGDLFHGYQMDPDPTHTEADLIDEACAARQGNPVLCSAYARGTLASRETIAPSRDDWNRVEALIAHDWPRASRRLARWQRDLASGARLDASDGEEQRQTCTRLLIDACTGDLGEVCTLREEDGDDAQPCDGELLPDGRCRQYHFTRLPLLPAQPAAR